MRKSYPAKLVAALAAMCLLASGGSAEANLFTRFFSAFRPPPHRYATSQRQKRGDDAATSASRRITTGRPMAKAERPAPVRTAAPGNSVLPAAKEAGGGKLLTGVLVPDKPGFLRSPYTQNQAVIDVRGFPSGTKVTDPSTGKTFLTP